MFSGIFTGSEGADAFAVSWTVSEPGDSEGVYEALCDGGGPAWILRVQ